MERFAPMANTSRLGGLETVFGLRNDVLWLKKNLYSKSQAYRLRIESLKKTVYCILKIKFLRLVEVCYLNTGRDKMKKIIIILLALAFVVGGCPTENLSFWKKGQVCIPKTFFNRTITYTVEPKAKEFLYKLEGLLAQSGKIDEPLPDSVLLPLYRDTDIDRNHYITAAEAETFYHEYVLKFEDTLGSVCY